MDKADLPSPETLRKLLSYDATTGELFWNVRQYKEFENKIDTAKMACAKWNAQHAGKKAFTAINSGYKCGRIFGRLYRAHRVIWAMVHGEWPSEDIDHINGDRGDNRIINLRAVSRAENRKNTARSKRNTSGIVGVYWNETCGKWRAEIGVNGKSKHLGMFQSRSEAEAARKSAEASLGFHSNHGRQGEWP